MYIQSIPPFKYILRDFLKISSLYGLLCMNWLQKMTNDDHQIVLELLLMHHGKF